MGEAYDVIIVGGGHNGLTAAAYLAMGGEKEGRNKLKVLVLERYRKPGGAAMSDEVYPGFTYSTCSYVCSLLRPEIFRFLDLPRHGLQVIPYEINGQPNPDGEGIVTYRDHDRTRESLRRHSIKDAEAYDHYAAEISRQCRFIKPLLMVTPPDPTRLNPFAQNRINPWGRRGDLDGFLKIAAEFTRMGEKQMYEIIRFWTMSIGDFLDEYFEHARWKGFSAASSIIGTALGPYSPGTAYVLLHHYMGEVDGQIGAWGFARGGMGSVSKAIAAAATEAGVEIRTDRPRSRRSSSATARPSAWRWRTARRSRPRPIVSNLDPKRTYLKLLEKGDSRCRRSRHPSLCHELQDPRLLRQAQHRARTGCRASPACRRRPPGAPSISAATSTTSSTPSTTTNTAAGRSGPSSTSSSPPRSIRPWPRPASISCRSSCNTCPTSWPRSPGSAASKAAFEKDVLDTIEENAPGFRKLVLHVQTRTPWDIENEVGLTEGNIFQGELTLDQLLFNRPFPGYRPVSRALRRLLHVRLRAPIPAAASWARPAPMRRGEILKDFKHRVIR